MRPEPARSYDRLPRWVRDRIETLERDLAHAREKLAAGPENSNTFADPYADRSRPLGTGTVIRFGGAGFGPTFDVHFGDGELHVRSNAGPASGDTAVIPWSSNSFRVRIVPRKD